MSAVHRFSVAAIVAASLFVASTAPSQEGSSQAGAARTRRLAALGRLPAPAEIVVEHFVNYHRHGIPLPKAGQDIALDLRWDTPLPGGAADSVLQIGMATARMHDVAHAAPLNLAIVVDCSLSMAEHDKMSRVRAALRRFAAKLRPRDRIALVIYSDEAAVALESCLFGDGARVRDAIEWLEPTGSTNLYAGLMLGYAVVARHRAQDVTNRVVLLTDGIANRGVTDPDRIAFDSLEWNRQGIDLSTIGVGVDLNRALLAKLAKSGRGLFHFVADEEDIGKVFDREIQSLMGAVARDIELEVSHGPGVRIVRIYGYEPERREDGCRIRLDDFNHGLTNVVLLRFRRCGLYEADERPRVSVRLSYTRPGRPERRIVIDRETRFLDPFALRDRGDHEVRKNFTIAVMARALRKMAEAAGARRLGEADRHLGLALEYARRYYPSTTDPDLLRMRRMLQKYRTVLDARIERFRDL
jgi:Mg-chelatase subunit ChlD